MLNASFPEVLDSTMLAAFRACPREFYLAHVLNRKPVEESIHLIAGAAFAAGLETARRCFFKHHLSAEDSIAEGLRNLTLSYGKDEPSKKYKNKSWDSTAGALVAYFGKYPLGVDFPPYAFDTNPCVEFSFAIPLEFKHPLTGNPLLFSGRCDQIANYDGVPYGMDEKTTGSLGTTWASQWLLRAQFMAYAWAMAEHGINIGGFIVRGIALRVTGYDFAQTIIFPQHKIKRWLWQTKRDITRMLECFRTNEWDFSLGETCNAYGGCPYRDLICSTENPDPFLEMYFEERKWNPLERTKTAFVQLEVQECPKNSIQR